MQKWSWRAPAAGGASARVIISLLALPRGPFNCCKTHSLKGGARRRSLRVNEIRGIIIYKTLVKVQSNGTRVFSAHCCGWEQKSTLGSSKKNIVKKMHGCLMPGWGSISQLAHFAGQCFNFFLITRSQNRKQKCPGTCLIGDSVDRCKQVCRFYYFQTLL